MKGDLICAGFYSERSSRNMKGAFFSKINASTKKMYDIKKGEWKSAADRSTFHTEFMSENVVYSYGPKKFPTNI